MGKVHGKVETDIPDGLNFNQEAFYRRILLPEEKSEQITIKITGPGGVGGTSFSSSSSCSSSSSSQMGTPKRISPIVPGASLENHAMVVQAKRIIKELTALQASVHLRIGLERKDKDFTTWEVEMYHVDPDSELCQEMYLNGVDHILLEMCFTNEFPYSPPTLKVLAPELHDPSHDLIKRDGKINMDRLAASWSSYTSIESLFVRLEVLLAKLKVELKKTPS
ncbi:ubiquitin-conjugating enzyme E2Q-like protein 1 [Neocloeon triangulifer]|uniref:ubiquitin-conjugating enzyme E2Q-like protein 1 n=1 Tax=Neocloeon triangulifer TaxID=2078957 RepID=UPI00286F4678|nr:ubiquitin-conjugating enzyme E2Q-like protein 1 [Neocloeon triangulifer]